MTPLERITERVYRHGDPNDPATPRPLLTLAEFFEGNSAIGSIGCNLIPTPMPAEICGVLKRIAQRLDVSDVRVQVTQFDAPDWPFSDTVWVITSAEPKEVLSWFDEEVRPDESWAGWIADMATERCFVPPGMQPVGCLWD